MEVNQLECCLVDVGSSVVVALVDQENNKSLDHRRRMNEDGPIGSYRTVATLKKRQGNVMEIQEKRR